MRPWIEKCYLACICRCGGGHWDSLIKTEQKPSRVRLVGIHLVRRPHLPTLSLQQPLQSYLYLALQPISSSSRRKRRGLEQRPTRKAVPPQLNIARMYLGWTGSAVVPWEKRFS